MKFEIKIPLEFCEKCDKETETVQIDIDGDDRPVIACKECEEIHR